MLAEQLDWTYQVAPVTADRRRRMIVACARELRHLAARRREYGVTAVDTRAIAIRKGFATGHEQNQRALSWFASVPHVARLTKTARTRLGRNRNRHTVYVLHEFFAIG